MSVELPEVEAAIAFMRAHLAEPLSLTDLATYVGYSPYHFIRLFKEQTGLSPLYYLSSLRLQRAKDLLLETNLTVRDIGLEIGQQSLGTFTTRFTQRVGVTPTAFRSSADLAEAQLGSLSQLARWPLATAPIATARVEGVVRAEAPFAGVILIGLFPKPVPEGLPLYGTLTPGLGPYALTGVQPGTYYLLATSVAWGAHRKQVLLPHETLRTRSREPLVVGSGVVQRDITLYPPRFDDPPILISLPLLMANFLKRNRQESNS